MTKYAMLICAIHALYIIYLFFVMDYFSKTKDEDEVYVSGIYSYVKENCIVFLFLLPIYLDSMGF